MNNLLELKGLMQSRSNPPGTAAVSFPKRYKVDRHHLLRLKRQLESAVAFWENHAELGGALISIHYKKVVPKSSRLRKLLRYGASGPSEFIRGVKFEYGRDEDNQPVPKHVFTLFMPLKGVIKAAAELDKAAALFESQWGDAQFDEETSLKLKQSGFTRPVPAECALSKSIFLSLMVDVVHIDRFGIDKLMEEFDRDQLISVYDTGVNLADLLAKYDINVDPDKIYNETTAFLTVDEANRLYSKAPYLISMSQVDFRKLANDIVSEDEETSVGIIPRPQTEPTIGVIDTHFDTGVYFSEWVDYRNMTPDERLTEEDYFHGTSVDSIIVDGPRGNPRLEDHCGRFKVRHFGVSRQSGFHSYKMLTLVRDIVRSNRDIRIWNLSLGSTDEINPNFISPVAAELDRLQREEGVLFVVAGTNVPRGMTRTDMRIGSPADSLNSIVVNSVASDGTPASYSRSGPVLSFFRKPDLCYYGGDSAMRGGGIVVCRKAGCPAAMVAGTSYAAPWIARKLAFLVHIVGLSPEVAKALLIDSAAKWDVGKNVDKLGYGLVPVTIEEILQSDDSEIRFFIQGLADQYENYTYQIPIPMDKAGYPYYARVTMAYFPYGNRNNGVDYTNTELDVHFGRVKANNKGEPSIEPFNANHQDDDGHHIYEIEARKIYRKWDNVKHSVELMSSRPRSRKVLGESRLWGISIKSKERTQGSGRDKVRYGLVITLREMFGKNRSLDFIAMCSSRGWIVNEVSIESRIHAYQEASNDIEIV